MPSVCAWSKVEGEHRSAEKREVRQVGNVLPFVLACTCGYTVWGGYRRSAVKGRRCVFLAHPHWQRNYIALHRITCTCGKAIPQSVAPAECETRDRESPLLPQRAIARNWCCTWNIIDTLSGNVIGSSLRRSYFFEFEAPTRPRGKSTRKCVLRSAISRARRYRAKSERGEPDEIRASFAPARRPFDTCPIPSPVKQPVHARYTSLYKSWNARLAIGSDDCGTRSTSESWIESRNLFMDHHTRHVNG